MNFETIYYENYNYVYKVAYRILRHKESAEDVLMEVFCKLYECMLQNKKLNNVSAWLLIVTKSTALDYARKNQKLNTVSIGEHTQLSEKDFSEQLITKTFVSVMLQDLYTYNPTWFEYVTMYYMLDMTYEEIAARCKTTPVAVKSALYRTRKYLTKKYSHTLTDFMLPAILILLHIVTSMD